VDGERTPRSRPWRFDLVLSADRTVSRQTQIVRAVIHEIQRGRLGPGAQLPGSRTLAAQLSVNRKVVVAAVDELVAQGWLETRPARGVHVAEHLPTLAVADVDSPKPRPVAARAPRVGALTIDDGIPDARIAPLDELARAYRRALRSLGRAGLGYGDPAGDPRLREVLSGFVNQARGLSSRPEQLVLTRGSQGALGVYALATLRAGDVVAVESPGYRPAWRAFELAGARIEPIPVDGEGLRTDALEARARALRGRLKAVYVTPHRHYPTTVSMTAERRLHLQELAERFDLTIVEDDYDYEYHFDGAPLLPLSASPPGANRCVYIASFSKLLAPAIRLGYMVVGPEVATRVGRTLEVLGRQGDVVLERAIAEMFEDGLIQRHARRARRLYEERRDRLLGELAARSALARAFSYDVPAGGLSLWIRLRRGTAESLARRAETRGVMLTPGSAHLAAGALAAFRFGYAAHTPAETRRVLDVLEACVVGNPTQRSRR